ncbi:MAG: aldo/keto reductase [Holophaga sp.]|nr:aldo/keto reductase [Holophaga sp.]
MEKRQLGKSDLKITPLGVGAWAMGGNNWAFGWGPQDDQDSIAAIHAALDAGWNWIDTAAVYGLGHSEEVVARALSGVAARPYLFTKCGLVWDKDRKVSGRLKRESVLRECEDSLRRLRVETIDLYQIHWPDPESELDEAWEAIEALKAKGSIRWAGVCNFSPAQIRRVAAKGQVTSLQPPYSIISPEVEAEHLPFCQREHLGVLVYSPMKSGLLTGKMTRERVAALPDDDFRKGKAQYQEPKLSRNLALADLLKTIGARHGRTAGEAAIAWCLRSPQVTGAIVGVRNAGQVAGVAGAAEFRLAPEEVGEITRFMASHPA